MTTATPTAAARRRAIAWARGVLADPRAVVLDTETTGLGDDAEICDIAIVGIDGRVLLDSLVKPSRPIPAEATAVHGIDDAMVAEAQPWGQVLLDLWPVIEGKVAVIYNAAYDVEIIERLSHGARIFGNRQCAMLAYSDFRGERGRFGTLKWHKLTEAAAYEGIEVDGAHRALADCLTTLGLIRAMASADDAPF